MIKPYVMDKGQVKKYSGISDTTYDTSIDNFLPVVSDDLTRKNGICNQSFLLEAKADAAGTQLGNVTLSATEWDCLYVGSVILFDGEDGVIASFDKEAETITLEAALTSTAIQEYLYIRNFPLGAKAIVSAMVMFKIAEASPNGGTMLKEIASRSVGPLSIAFDKASSNGGFGDYDYFGYPSSLTKSLKTIKRKRFF